MLTTGFTLKQLLFLTVLTGIFFCTGESSFKVKVEADSNDISEYPHYDQSSVGMIFCCILCSHWRRVGPEHYRIDHSVYLLFGGFFENFQEIA